MALHHKIAPKNKRGENLVIETAFVKLADQALLVGLSDNRICFAGFADDKDVIAKYYPKAEIVDFTGNRHSLERKLQDIWQDDQLNDLDIYVEGTGFQIDVWKHLMKIRAGQPLNYRDIAGKLNKSKAMRAVGNAVGANPVSVFIPCHRVVHAGGNKMGYAWGVDVKKQLLLAEQNL